MKRRFWMMMYGAAIWDSFQDIIDALRGKEAMLTAIQESTWLYSKPALLFNTLTFGVCLLAAVSGLSAKE